MAQAGVGGIYRCGGAARKDGATSLLMASHGDHTEVVKELTKAKADANAARIVVRLRFTWRLGADTRP